MDPGGGPGSPGVILQERKEFAFYFPLLIRFEPGIGLQLACRAQRN